MARGKISGKRVNLRDKPGMKSKVLGTLEGGTGLEILGEDEGGAGDWLKRTERHLTGTSNFNSDVRYQILGMFDFMTPEMKTALARKDYVTFAKNYNGSGQAVSYGKMIVDNVSEWARFTS